MTTDQKVCRIVLVDDHPIVREGLAMMMSQQPDLNVCGEAGSASEALDVLADLQPDLAIVDIFLDGTNGIELTREIRARYPKMPVLILSMHDEALYAERAIRAGAAGYVMKQEASRTIMDAIRTVMSGKRYISKSVADMLGDDSYADENTNSNALPQVDKLSRRELDIFRLIGEGRSRSEIAEVLDISTKTVETHRANIKYKLNAGSASDLKKYANEWLRSQLNNN
jgi:DNA-binding NarL/FixJ family response regulator